MKLKAAMNTTPPVPNQVNVSNPSTQLELSPVQLARLETCLLPHIGPIAGSLIRRALASTNNRENLAQILLDSVNDPSTQAKLMQEINAIMNE